MKKKYIICEGYSITCSKGIRIIQYDHGGNNDNETYNFKR